MRKRWKRLSPLTTMTFGNELIFRLHLHSLVLYQIMLVVLFSTMNKKTQKIYMGFNLLIKKIT